VNKRVSFARPARTKASEATAVATKGSGVGGRGVAPLKGVNHPPNTIPPQPDTKNEMNEEERLTWLLGGIEMLSAAGRKKLLAHLALEAQKLTGKADRDLDLWATSVYEAYTRAFGGSGEAGQGPLVFKRVLSPSNNWAPVADFMASSGLAAATVVKRQAVYRMLAHLVVARAKQVAAHTRAPVSPKFVANVAHDVRAIFDAEFPGYLAAGLAHRVAAQLGKASPNGTSI